MRVASLILVAALAGCALKSPPQRADLGKQALPNLAVPDKWAAPAAGEAGWGPRQPAGPPGRPAPPHSPGASPVRRNNQAGRPVSRRARRG